MYRIIIAILILSYEVRAQELPRISFDTESYDFGIIKEENGPVTYDFEVTNNGTEPLLILKVKPSCGCTVTSWTKEPILKGEKGLITARYNPRNRPGAFRKSLSVTTNNSSSIKRLYINGTVLPRTKTKEEIFPIKMGGLRFMSNSINMGRVSTEKTVEKTITFFNDSDSTITMNKEVISPEFIAYRFDSLEIAAKSEGKLFLKYNPNHDDNLGFNSHNILLSTDEKTDSLKELHVMASIVEYFGNLSENEKAFAPKMNIASRVFDFGKINEGNFYETEFVLTNQGKSNLNIRKVKSNCACLTYDLKNMNLAPGDSINLTLKLNTKDRKGNQIKNVTIFSNDPSDPTQLVTIKGNVKTD